MPCSRLAKVLAVVAAVDVNVPCDTAVDGIVSISSRAAKAAAVSPLRTSASISSTSDVYSVLYGDAVVLVRLATLNISKV